MHPAARPDVSYGQRPCDVPYPPGSSSRSAIPPRSRCRSPPRRASGSTSCSRSTSTASPSPGEAVDGAHGGRAHVARRRSAGTLAVTYAATVIGRATPPTCGEDERLVYLRPSRYAESDRLAEVGRRQFGGLTDAADILGAVSSWVGWELGYEAGSSLPTHGAVDTLLGGRGVCRDFAHLVVALLRARDVPARVAAVYAPGLQPMDFHAVAEALVDGTWRVVDATLLAPRSSLVRIATGRDAADTAFLTVIGGTVDLVGLEVERDRRGEPPHRRSTRARLARVARYPISISGGRPSRPIVRRWRKCERRAPPSDECERVADAVLGAVAPHDLRDLRVVRVRNLREEVVLDLEVEPAEHPRQHRVARAEVDGRLDLVHGPDPALACGARRPTRTMPPRRSGRAGTSSP